MGIVVKEAERLSGLLTDFLIFARPPGRIRRRWTFPPCSTKLADMVASDRRFSRIEIRRRYPTGNAECVADRQQLRQALWNLMINGAEAMEGGGSLPSASMPRGARIYCRGHRPRYPRNDSRRKYSIPFSPPRTGAPGSAWPLSTPSSRPITAPSKWRRERAAGPVSRCGCRAMVGETDSPRGGRDRAGTQGWAGTRPAPTFRGDVRSVGAPLVGARLFGEVFRRPACPHPETWAIIRPLRRAGTRPGRHKGGQAQDLPLREPSGLQSIVGAPLVGARLIRGCPQFGLTYHLNWILKKMAKNSNKYRILVVDDEESMREIPHHHALPGRLCRSMPRPTASRPSTA